jgi:hypothetical protein
MGPNGPLGASFDPPAPIFTPASPDQPALFADWGTAVALTDGGFAFFVEPAAPSRGGQISPSGWYARYPSGEPRTAPPPGFLQRYDGSLTALDNGAGYAAAVRNPGSCGRTALLIAPSGRICFSLPVDGSDLCDSKAAFFADGTFAVQRGCELRFWPGLLRPHAPERRSVTAAAALGGDIAVDTEEMEGSPK